MISIVNDPPSNAARFVPWETIRPPISLGNEEVMRLREILGGLNCATSSFKVASRSGHAKFRQTLDYVTHWIHLNFSEFLTSFVGISGRSASMERSLAVS